VPISTEALVCHHFAGLQSIAPARETHPHGLGTGVRSTCFGLTFGFLRPLVFFVFRLRSVAPFVASFWRSFAVISTQLLDETVAQHGLLIAGLVGQTHGESHASLKLYNLNGSK